MELGMPIQAPRSSATCQNPRNIGSILQGSVKKSGQKTQEIILNQEGRFLYILAMIGISCFIGKYKARILVMLQNYLDKRT